jgi:H+/gluconate symporter-like permease
MALEWIGLLGARALLVALLAGVLVVLVVNRKYFVNLSQAVTSGPIAKLSPAFAAAVDAQALHRVVAIASGGLDSLPHNGYVVTTIRGVSRETPRSAYWPVFCLTAVMPLLGVLVALLLFSI